MIRSFCRRFVLAFQFLTRIPIRAQLRIGEGDFSGCMVFFPIVGAVIGGTMALVFWGIRALLPDSYYVSALFPIIAGVMITGGLHLDGLADTCDGVFSGRPKERMLEIMKDSRSGAFGVMAIVFAVLGKVLFIGEISAACSMDIEKMILLVVSMPVLGRLGVVTAAALGKSARSDGLGKLFLDDVGVGHWLIAAALTAIAMFLFWGWIGFVYLACSVVVACLVTWFCSKKLGGLTGDCLGAANEFSEIIFLLVFDAVQRFFI